MVMLERMLMLSMKMLSILQNTSNSDRFLRTHLDTDSFVLGFENIEMLVVAVVDSYIGRLVVVAVVDTNKRCMMDLLLVAIVVDLNSNCTDLLLVVVDTKHCIDLLDLVDIGNSNPPIEH